MKRILMVLISVYALMSVSAHKVTVKSYGLEKLTDTDNITELIIDGDIDILPDLNVNNFPNLKHIVINGDVSYLPGTALRHWPALETLDIIGVVGYTDGLIFYDCPKLRTVNFNGPVIFTSGWPILNKCPKAEHVYINGLVLQWEFDEVKECPSFRGYEINGAILNKSRADIAVLPYDEFVARKEEFMPQMKQLAQWVKKSLAGEIGENSFKQAYLAQDYIKSLLDNCDAVDLYAGWVVTGPYVDPDFNLPKLDLLKKSAPYTSSTGQRIDFTYSEPSDSILTVTRLRFNLDSVAGNGDELSRIKNLLHFVHESVRHNGSAPAPQVPANFGALYDICKKENRSLNCYFMAVMLTEVLLAEGIPARFLVCLPKFCELDSDSHIIATAWSRDLKKWVWVDPTFDAWVTDENGVMLSPEEVRKRLIADEPLVINDYANWNHENDQTVDHYLKEYMAKNLYIIGCNTINQAEPEGTLSCRSVPVEKGKRVYLVPEGISYGGSYDIQTTDPDVFWAPPVIPEK